jgi:hypothetical protein
MRNIIKHLTNLVFVLFGLGPDVVTVSLGTAGNAGSTAAELITYMSARLLEVAEFNTILDQFGKFCCRTKTCSEYHGNPVTSSLLTRSNLLEDFMQDNQRQADLARRDLILVLAGLFAGEGCVQIRKSNRKSKSPSLVVELGNTERLWCDLLQDNFGGFTRVYFPKRQHSLPYHHWTIKDEKAAAFLDTIYPFLLGEKRQQAELGIQLAKIKAQRPNRNKTGKFGHFLPEEIASMERLELALKELRRAAAETKRASAQPVRNDSPTLLVTADN